MRKLVSIAATVSSLLLASPAFAALEAYTNTKGQTVQAEVKNGMLVDAGGKVLADDDWSKTTGGQVTRVTVKQGKVTATFNPFTPASKGQRAAPPNKN